MENYNSLIRSKRFDDDGQWVTTENGHHVHINGEGEPDKGNPHVIDKMHGGSGSSGKNASSSVDVSKFSFKDYRNPDGQRRPGYETYRSAMKSMASETEKVAQRLVKSYCGGMNPYQQAYHAFEEINRHSSVRDMVGPRSEQGLKDCKDAIYKRQEAIRESLKGLTEWDRSKREWVAP